MKMKWRNKGIQGSFIHSKLIHKFPLIDNFPQFPSNHPSIDSFIHPSIDSFINSIIQSMTLTYLRWQNQRFQLIQMKLRHHQPLLPKRHPIRHELPRFLLDPGGISALVLRAQPLQPFHSLLSTRLVVRFVLQLHAKPRVLLAEVFDLFLQRFLLLFLPFAAVLRDFAVFLQATLTLLFRLRSLDWKGRDARTRWNETFSRSRSYNQLIETMKNGTTKMNLLLMIIAQIKKNWEEASMCILQSRVERESACFPKHQ